MWRLFLSLLVLLTAGFISTDAWAQGSCRRGPSTTANVRKVPGGLPLPSYYSRSRNSTRSTGLVATPFINSTALLNYSANSENAGWDAAPVAKHYWNQSMVSLPEWLAPQRGENSPQSTSANRPANTVPQPPMADAEQLRLLPFRYFDDQVGATLDDFLFSTAVD